MSSLRHDLGRFLLEFQGRKRAAVRYPFENNQITAPGRSIRIHWLWNATYLNLHPTQYAVAIAPDGRVMHLRGGYNFPLPTGRYILHYVDKQNRVLVMPRVSETTRDGSQVSLEIVVTYRVIDPIKALDVQQPVETLRVFISSDLKEFVRSHNYDDIVGGSQGRGVDSTRVSNYIKDQHSGRHQMSKLFFIADIAVEEQLGDPSLSEIRVNFQREQRQNAATSELLKQKQALETKVASQEAEIQQIKAQSEAKQQEIQQKMKLQSMELERARAELTYRQEIMRRAMDAIGQAFSSSAYPMDAREVEIIKEIIGELRGTPGSVSEVAAEQDSNPPSKLTSVTSPERLDTLTATLLNWLDYKRS
jgi:regulator of protease activity HflC (stomatin/prohibitin superfamily)